jgi:hypothetical protein
MTKRELLLLALAAGGTHEHTPVQVQKLLFLIEKGIGQRLGGPVYSFVPYDYGPFDSSIYSELRDLEREGLAVARPTPRGWRVHALTDAGLAEGEALLRAMPVDAQGFIKELSGFVLRTPFAALVSAVYKAYPEMKANSVFRE